MYKLCNLSNLQGHITEKIKFSITVNGVLFNENHVLLLWQDTWKMATNEIIFSYIDYNVRYFKNDQYQFQCVKKKKELLIIHCLVN